MSFLGLTTESKRKKEKHRRREEHAELKNLRANAREPNLEAVRKQAKIHAHEMNQTAMEGRKAHQKRGEEFHARKFTGLTPEERARHESDAARRINRQIQGHQRELIGKQGHHGVRGGSAYAQKADLARLGMEAKNEANSAIRGMDQDLALKKMASQFAIEEGGAAEYLTNEQQAANELLLENERKRNRRHEAQFNRIRG
jgi:hypothetical protein